MKGKIYATCGKICSGKTTYAKKLAQDKNAVVLSCDELMLKIFGQHLGDAHDEIAEKTKSYLMDKSIEIATVGTNVILDWGLWQKSERVRLKDFYLKKGFDFEIHFIDTPEDVRNLNILKRNKDVSGNGVTEYYVDENLAKKVDKLFETPDMQEIDIYIREG